MRVAFIGPWALQPKGTVQARVVPLALHLAGRGCSLRVILPPYDNPSHSGASSMVNGFEVRNVRIPVGVGPLRYLIVSIQLVLQALSFAPDIVHVFKPKGYSGLAAMMLVALRRLRVVKAPLIIDTDDLEGFSGFGEYFLRIRRHPAWLVAFIDFQEKWILRNADSVTVASRTLRQVSELLGVPATMILYIPNGPVNSGFQPDSERIAKLRSELGLSGVTSIALYTRFLEYDYKRLVALLSIMKKRIQRFRLLVIGRGENGEEERFLQLAHKEGLTENIKYVGWLTPGRIPEYLMTCDLAIYPFDDNMRNRAKCPGKLVELMSLGMPIVAEEVGQIREYIVDQESGLLVEPGDNESFAESVARLSQDSLLRQRIASAAKTRVNSEFSWEKRADELLALYSASYRSNRSSEQPISSRPTRDLFHRRRCA